MGFVKGTLVSAAVGFALAAPAWASFVITPTFGGSITADPNAGAIEGIINSAISTYEADFADNINVAITFNEMSSGLGQSSSAFNNVSYTAYLAALTTHATTADDATALAHLPPGPNNPVTGTATINVHTANLRALGLPGGAVASDGTIGLNTSLTFPGSPGTSNTYSLLAVTEHEIDEVLGLGSALPTLPSPPFNTIFPEDLFRYDNAGHRSFTATDGAAANFSIDGTTILAPFHNTNDGSDYGDWQNGGPARVQDAVGTAGATPALGVELVALDVIGYDRIIASVPEPGTGALLAISLAALAGLTRKRAA
jgi:hypothetical protein